MGRDPFFWITQDYEVEIWAREIEDSNQQELFCRNFGGHWSTECEHYRQYCRLVVLFFLVFSKFLLDISSSRVKRWQTRFILS